MKIVQSFMADAVEDERLRRESLMEHIQLFSDNGKVPARILRESRVYLGYRGIWVDKEMMTSSVEKKYGVTVSVRHTGQYYADELSDEYLLYHFPRTKRSGQDRQEINATVNAYKFKIPIFVIIGPKNVSSRVVKLGYVVGCNGQAGIFLISFNRADQAGHLVDVPDDAPFDLKEGGRSGSSLAKTRPDQPKFKYQVFERYGARCAVCDVHVNEMLQAAHICGREFNGTNNPKNGLVLCANHHCAYDRLLFSIDPVSLKIVTKTGAHGLDELKITQVDINYLLKKPHDMALKWHWELFGKQDN